MANTERRTAGEPNPETLKTNDYAGLWARFYLASKSPQSELAGLLDPASTVDIMVATTKTTLETNYSPIAQKLSIQERISAWPPLLSKTSFDEAKQKWRADVKRVITRISDKDELRLEALRLVLPDVEHSKFKVGDAETLYDDYCDGASNTDAFVKNVTQRLTVDGHVDMQKLSDLTTHLEWISSMLFGKETAKAVSRMIEVQAQITNEPAKLADKLFHNKTRINNLSTPEKDVLGLLYNGLQKDKSTASEATPVATKSLQERTREIYNAMEAVRRGETPINPATGKPLTAISQEHAIRALKEQLQELSKQAGSQPITPDLAAEPTLVPKAEPKTQEPPTTASPIIVFDESASKEKPTVTGKATRRHRTK
jgi:hypothetical protein